MRHMHGSASARMFAVAITLTDLIACSAPVPLPPPETYLVDAGGRPAIIDDVIELSWGVDERPGLILNAELCDGHAYLLAPSVKTVQVADLNLGRVVRRIGRPGNGPGDLRRPVSIGVDCRDKHLYVAEGPGGLLTFDLESGAYVRTLAHADEFRPSMGSRMAIADDGASVVLAGLWPAEKGAYDRQHPSQMYSRTNLGLELPLSGGSNESVSPALEPGCEADTTACLRVDVQPLANGVGWIVGQGGSTRIAVLSSERQLIRTLDVRSPQFFRDGTSARGQVEDLMKWGETNNTIWGIYGLDDLIAVVHARHRTKNWVRGQIVQYDVFMNLYSTNGRRLVSDIRLPDLPVGHDGSHILVMDYGSAGRHPDVREIRLLRVRVAASSAGFHADS